MYHVGTRYRYTERRNSLRAKLASWAIKPDANPDSYKLGLGHVQNLGNSSVRRVEGWGPGWRKLLRQQRALLDVVTAKQASGLIVSSLSYALYLTCHNIFHVMLSHMYLISHVILSRRHSLFHIS